MICLLSDGMNNHGPDGLAERAAIDAFNAAQQQAQRDGRGYQGRIRLATIGYYQFKKDPTRHNIKVGARDADQKRQANEMMDAEQGGRELLAELARPTRPGDGPERARTGGEYFETNQARQIAEFLRRTVNVE